MSRTTVGGQKYKIEKDVFNTVMKLRNPETGYLVASQENVKKVFGNEIELKKIIGTTRSSGLNYSRLRKIAERINKEVTTDMNVRTKKLEKPAWNPSPNPNSPAKPSSGKGLKNLMKRYVKKKTT